jgi:hypothetical protein
MAEQYVHPELNVQVESIAGYYRIDGEALVAHSGQELLVAFGCAVADTSCCGAGTGCRFANVAGYVLAWKARAAPNGAPISDVERIVDPAARQDIKRLIDAIEPHCQVNFL